MTQSHRSWFITSIWKLDHRLNMTLGTDIKFTLSFLSAKSLCWRKWILSYFKTEKLWSEDNLITNGWSGAYLVTWTVLCFQFHTSVTSKFQGQPLLSNSCWTASQFLFTIYTPQSPVPSPKLRLTRVRMREFSQPEGIPSGTEALWFILLTDLGEWRVGKK